MSAGFQLGDSLLLSCLEIAKQAGDPPLILMNTPTQALSHPLLCKRLSCSCATESHFVQDGLRNLQLLQPGQHSQPTYSEAPQKKNSRRRKHDKFRAQVQGGWGAPTLVGAPPARNAIANSATVLRCFRM